MPGIVSFAVGAFLILGGLGAAGTAHDEHLSTAPGMILLVGGMILMAMGRVIYILADILSALKSAKTK
jgi:hypothetical protein